MTINTTVLSEPAATASAAAREPRGCCACRALRR